MNLLGNRFVHAIFCEEVRAEVKGGSTYVGVFKSAIVLSKPPPLKIRSFTAVVWVITSYNDVLDEIKLSLKVPGKKDDELSLDPPLKKSDIIDSKSETDRRLGVILIDYGPLSIKEMGVISLSAIVGEESAVVATVRIRLKEGSSKSDPQKEKINTKTSSRPSRRITT